MDSKEQIRKEAVEVFEILWQEYVEVSPDTLTDDAKALRKFMIDLVHSEAQ